MISDFLALTPEIYADYLLAYRLDPKSTILRHGKKCPIFFRSKQRLWNDSRPIPYLQCIETAHSTDVLVECAVPSTLEIGY